LRRPKVVALIELTLGVVAGNVFDLRATTMRGESLFLADSYWLACENGGTPACARRDLAFGQYILTEAATLPASRPLGLKRAGGPALRVECLRRGLSERLASVLC
jgi:hypothetical protein